MSQLAALAGRNWPLARVARDLAIFTLAGLAVARTLGLFWARGYDAHTYWFMPGRRIRPGPQSSVSRPKAWAFVLLTKVTPASA